MAVTREKKQVLFIHGAMAFSNYDAFLEYLKTTPIRNPFGDAPRRWKDSLRSALADVAEVMTPSMPNKQNAKYDEWKIWFERHVEYLQDGAILIGHSQGGYFLAKYLSENTMPIRVRALYLVSAPIGADDFGGEDGGDFTFDASRLAAGTSAVGDVFIFHDEEDPVVPFTHATSYLKAVPKAQLVSFTGRGHFLEEEFPELVSSIRAVLGEGGDGLA